MLGVPGALKSRIEGSALVIETPALSPNDIPCRHAYTFKIAGATLSQQ